ncbi:MAG UNVERIFIED_CONTAM: hypothetical protein LVQ98_03200 [Rickettsiaceae bacterium]|jgi:hypothetical protein
MLGLQRHTKGATSKDFTFNPSDRISNYKEGFKPGVNLPALLPINIPFYLYVIPVILAAAIIFSSMVFFQDKLSFIGLVGASQNLKVHDINISYDKEHGNIVASYKVVNASQEFVPLSNIRIRLLDSHHKVLKSHIADHAHSNLAPRQYVTIRTNFSEAPPNVEYIDITLGSKFDFILR